MCGWAAVLQVGIAFVLFWLPSSQNAHYLFLWVAFCFLVLCLRSRRDLKLLKLAGQQRVEETAPHALRYLDYPRRPSCSAAGSTRLPSAVRPPGSSGRASIRIARASLFRKPVKASQRACQPRVSLRLSSKSKRAMSCNSSTSAGARSRPWRAFVERWNRTRI